jgi:CHAT domain-containing protein
VVAVVERIQRDAKRQAAVWYPRAAPTDEISKWLSDGDALVLYGVLGEDALALVATQADARVVALGKSAAIHAACGALDASDAAADPMGALARLRDLLIKPLDLEKANTKRLLVSPEGPLCYVPFSALVPDLPLVTVPSGTTYGLLLEEEGKKRGESVLAAGDADYTAARDETAAATYERGIRLSPLPGTRAEAKAVGDVVLLGKDASEAGIAASLRERPRWRAVHFACHGLVDPERPTLSSLALSPDAHHDGYLTALEVLDLEVPADLVVLSACETGKGKIINGEGIVGLTRAFMFAGAPRVICSLWKVDDAATSAMMTEFYRLWNPKDGKPGLSTAEALRKAQEFVRSQPKWKHPYYWAAWVLWGLPS